MVYTDVDKVSVSGTALHFAPIGVIATLKIHNTIDENDIFVKIDGI